MERESDNGPTVVRQDPVEMALAAGIQALAGAMSRARPDDLAALADRMAVLARELEARRHAASGNVIAIDGGRRAKKFDP